jgi:hypothetical protein
VFQTIVHGIKGNHFGNTCIHCNAALFALGRIGKSTSRWWEVTNPKIIGVSLHTNP